VQDSHLLAGGGPADFGGGFLDGLADVLRAHRFIKTTTASLRTAKVIWVFSVRRQDAARVTVAHHPAGVNAELLPADVHPGSEH
jgi:hypothetical protein